MPYVSNEDRSRLGLVHWGSDVPQDVLDAALAAAAGCCAATATPEAPAPKRRARAASGEFKADDPTTPDVNEAFEEG